MGRIYLALVSVLFAGLFTIANSQDNSQKVDLNAAWKQADEILSRIKAPEFPDKSFLITDFGAKEGGVVMCTEAINKAIETCNSKGGGKVIIPNGVFLTGPIVLKSNVNLHLSDSAALLFSNNPDDYLPVVLTRFEGVECMNYSPFIYAYGQENIAVTGKGKLDGNADKEHWWYWKGKKDYGWEEGMPKQSNDVKKLNQMGEDNVPVKDRVFGKGFYLRPNFIQPYNCKNVLIEGVTIVKSPMWELNPVLCENVIVKDVIIMSHGPNNDGCDPESCTDVLIEGCYFDTGDDCIAIKSGRNADGRRINVPSKNIIIRNCHMKDGHGGVVIGSEISGGVSNVFAENCIMDSPNLDRCLRLKTNSIRGGVLENIYMRNITIGEVKIAILSVNFMYQEGDAGEFTPVVRNIYLQNVTSKKSQYAIYLDGYERSPISNIYMENCTLEGITSDDLNYISHAEKITLNNVRINGELQKVDYK